MSETPLIIRATIRRVNYHEWRVEMVGTVQGRGGYYGLGKLPDDAFTALRADIKKHLPKLGQFSIVVVREKHGQDPPIETGASSG